MPYTYLITHKPTSMKYYGVRYAKDAIPSDLGVSYFSSSKHIKKMIKEDGVDSFTFDVRRTFTTKEQALQWENKVLRRINAVESDMWINKHEGDPNWIRPSLPHSDKTKEKMRKPKSDQHRVKLKKHLDKVRKMPKWDDDRKAAQSNMMKNNKINLGRKQAPISEEERERRRQRATGNTWSRGVPKKFKERICPHCNKLGKGGNMTRYHFDNCKQR